MTYITEYAKESTVPRKILRLLNKEGLLSDPLCDTDFLNLRFLEKIWGNKTILRTQLGRMSYQAKRNFLLTAHLKTKWERYVFIRFFNFNGKKDLPLQVLMEEVQTTFGFHLNAGQVRRMQLLKKRAKDARKRETEWAGRIGIAQTDK